MKKIFPALLFKTLPFITCIARCLNLRGNTCYLLNPRPQNMHQKQNSRLPTRGPLRYLNNSCTWVRYHLVNHHKIRYPTPIHYMKFRQTLFWDTDVKKIDPKKNARYIIKRVMEFVTDKETQCMCKTYPHRLLHDVAKKSRVLRPETRT